MSSRLERHLAKWREDVQSDIDNLTAELDELLAVREWLDEQAGAPAPVPPEPEAPAPESESEAIPGEGEAPVSPAEGEAPEATAPKGRWGTYTRVSLAQVRDCVRTRGPSTAREVAEALGASDGNVRPKLQKWVENGTMEAERVTVGKSTMMVYSMKGIEHPPLRARRQQSHSSLRLVGGVAGTGRRNVKVMKRRGKIKGAKGQ